MPIGKKKAPAMDYHVQPDAPHSSGTELGMAQNIGSMAAYGCLGFRTWVHYGRVTSDAEGVMERSASPMAIITSTGLQSFEVGDVAFPDPSAYTPPSTPYMIPWRMSEGASGVCVDATLLWAHDVHIRFAATLATLVDDVDIIAAQPSLAYLPRSNPRSLQWALASSGASRRGLRSATMRSTVQYMDVEDRPELRDIAIVPQVELPLVDYLSLSMSSLECPVFIAQITAFEIPDPILTRMGYS